MSHDTVFDMVYSLKEEKYVNVVFLDIDAFKAVYVVNKAVVINYSNNL